MEKFTPGPWSVSEDGGIVDADGCVLADTEFRNIEGEEKANARLIAAAPETAAERDKLKEINADLLKALKAMVRFYDGKKDDRGVIWNTVAMAASKDIIAKVEGKS